MKKILLFSFLLLTGTFAFSQKTMQVYRNGNVVYAESVSQIDSLKFGELLPAPAGVAAALNGAAIDISWSSVAGATSYELYRSGNNTTYSLLQSGITATSYKDTAPLNGSNYYKVKAVNATAAGMLSGASSTVSFSGSGANEQVYIGVVAFNSGVSVFPVSNDLDAAKSFISSKNNDIDRTALCYAVSKSVTLFDAQGLPAFNKIFVVSFTDGIDNGSSSLYVADGRQIPQGQVYDAAHADLAAKAGLDAYTIGFGDQPLAASMQKLITGRGEYKQSNSSTLNSTFQEIAQSVIASSKNIVLRTQDGLYTEQYPKYVRLTVSTSAGSDVITAKIVGQTLSIVTPGAYATFDSPAQGTVSAVDNKIEIPLNNFKFVKSGTEYPFNIAVQMSYDNTVYYNDTEDTSAEEAISKKIAVVLVLDCSTSLGSNFAPMQTAANNFINTLATQVGTIPAIPVNGVVINGITWAPSNIGSSRTFVANPENYGELYTFDEAQTVCPAGWRVPTQAELQSLVNAGNVWTTVNGINGHRFGTAPNTIFLPAAGYRNINASLANVGTSGNYWSSTVNGTYAYYLTFNGSAVSPASVSSRANGFSVRCVAE